MNTNKILELVHNDESIKESIGTKQEKTVHQFLKYYICNNSEYHEININRNVVDVLIDDHIYEIQTRSFNSLRSKLDKLLDNYQITIVYPLCIKKMLYKVNESGEIIQIRKSPKKLHPLSIGYELYKIKNYLKHPNLSFKIVLLDVNEFNTTRINRRKQTRLTRIDQFPNEILGEYNIYHSSDWKYLMPDIDMFTTKDFIKATKMSLKQAGSTLNVLRYLDVIEVVDKNKNAYIYKIKKES